MNTWKPKGPYIVKEGVDYIIHIYQTNRGDRCDIVDYSFFNVRTNLSIKSAKAWIRKETK